MGYGQWMLCPIQSMKGEYSIHHVPTGLTAAKVFGHANAKTFVLRAATELPPMESVRDMTPEAVKPLLAIREDFKKFGLLAERDALGRT